MKRLCIGLLVFSFIATDVNAQILYGVKFGPNFSTIKGEEFDDPDKKAKLGIALGGFLNIPLNEMFRVQPELVFSQEGALWKDGDYRESETLSYINVPVLAQYNSTSGFFAQTGPQIGLLLSAKENYENEGESEKSKIEDFYKSTVFSWALGAGYRHSGGVGVEARYNLGLSGIAQTQHPKANGSCFNVSVLYVLGKLNN